MPLGSGDTLCQTQAGRFQGRWGHMAPNSRLDPWSYGQDCPFVRASYKCSAALTASFRQSCALDPPARPPPPNLPPFQPKFTVLWMGSSHDRQPFESLLCQYQRHIERTEVSAFLVDYDNASRAHASVMCSRGAPLYAYHGALSEPPNMFSGWHGWPGHHGPEVVASDNLVRVRFVNGARLLGAFNSHAALGGLLGVMHEFGIASIRKLDAVVAGPAHPLKFFQSVYGPCPWWPRTAQGQSNVQAALAELQNHSSVVEALSKLGFRGAYIGHGLDEPFDAPDGMTVLQAPSAAQANNPLGCACAVPSCTRACGHQCMPGPPDQVSLIIAHLLRPHVLTNASRESRVDIGPATAATTPRDERREALLKRHAAFKHTSRRHATPIASSAHEPPV